MTFEYFAYYVITSLGQAATTFVSQNFAAHQLDRCRRITGICLFLSFISCALITVPLSVFCQGASSLFTQNTSEIEMSCQRIMLILVFEPICTFYEIPAGTLRGFGYSALPAVKTIIGTCLFRMLVTFSNIWLSKVLEHGKECSQMSADMLKKRRTLLWIDIASRRSEL